MNSGIPFFSIDFDGEAGGDDSVFNSTFSGAVGLGEELFNSSI